MPSGLIVLLLMNLQLFLTKLPFTFNLMKREVFEKRFETGNTSVLLELSELGLSNLYYLCQTNCKTEKI